MEAHSIPQHVPEGDGAPRSTAERSLVTARISLLLFFPVRLFSPASACSAHVHIVYSNGARYQPEPNVTFENVFFTSISVILSEEVTEILECLAGWLQLCPDSQASHCTTLLVL